MGITQLILDRSEDRIVAYSWQDCEDIVERNKALRQVEQKSDWGRHIATIPNVILHKWCNEEWARGNVNFRLFTREADELVARKLKDPEWAYLRTDCKAVQGYVGWGD